MGGGIELAEFVQVHPIPSYTIWLRLVVWLIKGNGNLAELGPAAEKAPTSHHHRFELERRIVEVLRLSELNAETAVCADLARNLQVQVLKFIPRHQPYYR